MFKFRSGGQGTPSPTQPPTIEAMRRRARHRLIGASVLVLAGVIGFPLLFDSKPRPIPVDIPIDIPAKGGTKPLVLSKPEAPSAVVDGLDAREEVVASKPPANTNKAAALADAGSASATVAATPAASKDTAGATQSAKVGGTVKPASTVTKDARVADNAVGDTKPVAQPVETAKPTKVADSKPDVKTAKLDKSATDKPADKAHEKDKGDLRIVVQVGAFAESDRAHAVRQKLEHAGLKTYTHVADTADGKRIRVRLGPFATRAEADKAAAKVKALGLPAAILTL